jgi:hypothetical protein
MAPTPTAYITKTQAKASANPKPTRVSNSDQAPLALTDDQLDQIVRCAAPLHPELRRVFVEHVAHALRGKTIGDGTVYLACRQVLRENGMFDPPELESGRMPRVSKWDR